MVSGDKMNNVNDTVWEIIEKPFFQILRDEGLINEKTLRDLKIKRDFENLRASMGPLDAIYELAKKYTCSEATVHSAVYRKN